MLDLGVTAPDFTLPNQNTRVGATEISLGDFADAKGLLVMFVCNHCPYVVHLREALVAFVNDYQSKGLQVVAISANSPESHPQDGPDKMAEQAVEYDFPYPYLFDQSQQVAKAYKAACTPDFFLFDGEKKLVYRGQFDGSRPNNGQPVTGADLRTAADALLNGDPIPEPQMPSMGCNIKWAEGNEPSYAG